jgi:hypothetical protein
VEDSFLRSVGSVVIGCGGYLHKGGRRSDLYVKIQLYHFHPLLSSSSFSLLSWRNPKTNICQYLLDSCLDILLKYRQICSSHSPKGQLILPEALKILPLYTLCLIKHPAFLHNNLANNTAGTQQQQQAQLSRADRLGVDVCERAAELNRLLRCSPRELLRSLYPRLYPLHQLQEGDGYPPEDEEFEENEVSSLLPSLLCVDDVLVVVCCAVLCVG